MNRKIISALLVIVSLSVMLCGCGKNAGKTPGTDEVAEKIQESGGFTELVSLTDENIGRRYYGINLDDIDEYCVLVCSSGAIADEIAVFKMKSHDEVEDMIDLVGDRKQELYDGFVDYVPEETGKIEQAVIGSNGNYVYFIVCEDRKAAKAAAESCF